MAIDPDMQPIIDDLNARIATLEAAPGGTGPSAVDNAWLRYIGRVSDKLLPMTEDERVAWLDGQAV